MDTVVRGCEPGDRVRRKRITVDVGRRETTEVPVKPTEPKAIGSSD